MAQRPLNPTGQANNVLDPRTQVSMPFSSWLLLTKRASKIGGDHQANTSSECLHAKDIPLANLNLSKNEYHHR
jgi:hypothetical protein